MASVLVTGSNRGIGLEYCRQLRERGFDVIAVCREPSPELQALDVRVEAGLDQSDPGMPADLTRRLDGLSLHWVILNAGMLESIGFDQLDEASIRRQFEVNALAPLRLVRALVGQMPSGGKLALMSSRMASIDDNTSGGSYGYRMSKAALNSAGKSLAHDLRSRGIAVAILHPGLVSTRMIGFNPRSISPEQAVSGLLARIDALNLDTSGTFWHANGEVLPW
ncbi:short-chain dehydrogenase/reductase (SDR) superfamily [Synechococcus sp. PROS-7-1]|uniref:SDR family oxidoreductase n=1 Tax=Synechococcus sp. PROS-7-1 TaxID=1442556 RepID=UPI00164441D8|nr:SDR family oxidoreductase [Synechococcus sp. PROS-7-1]QNI84788.1 short-chain dehydrogenase/reductase (SDR) superfamily [Synechococcus sp. PROS-7-1]